MTARIIGLFGVLAVALLAGCTTAPLPTPPPPSVTPVPMASPPAPIPTGLAIPALGITADLIPTGVNGDDTLATPPTSKPELASWYVGSPEPGEPGPAVILGHVNGSGRAGVFARLHELKPGADIVVHRDNAPDVHFTVRAVERYAKDRFPTERVYGTTKGAELRLITCGGVFDQSRRTSSSQRGSYTDNWVAFAELNDGRW